MMGCLQKTFLLVQVENVELYQLGLEGAPIIDDLVV